MKIEIPTKNQINKIIHEQFRQYQAQIDRLRERVNILEEENEKLHL